MIDDGGEEYKKVWATVYEQNYSGQHPPKQLIRYQKLYRPVFWQMHLGWVLLDLTVKENTHEHGST